MTPALVVLCFYFTWVDYNTYKAQDHCLIIDVWAVENLKAMINDGPCAFFLFNAHRGQGKKRYQYG